MSLIQTYIFLPQVDTLTEPVTTTPMPDRPVVFLHRQNASINFYRPWADYRNEFGSPDTNYWMGLDPLHTLTSSRAYGLMVNMTDWEGKTLWAEYDRFSVGPESSLYKMRVGGYHRDSTVPDQMAFHSGYIFSTYDRDNDNSKFHCARQAKGGWWYTWCYHVHPTGVYLPDGACGDITGIVWKGARGYCDYYSFKRMTFTLIPQ